MRMATVDPEKKLQSRVLHWLKDDLGYTYIGDLRDIDNTPIKEDLLSANLKKRGYTDDQIKTAIGELVNKAGNQVDSLYQINRSVYSLLRYGRQGTKDAHGHRPTVHYIDWLNPENNDFAVVDELPFSIEEGTEEGSFRPDINILINGMPLAFLEVKKPNNEGGIQREFDRMIKKRLQKKEYKKYFNLIQFVSFSNNMEYEEDDDAEDVKAGSFYTTPNGNSTSFSFFREDDENYRINYKYKNIEMTQIKEVMKDCGYNTSETDTPEFAENLRVDTPCNSFVTSVFDKERFLYFSRNFNFAIIFTKLISENISYYFNRFIISKGC